MDFIVILLGYIFGRIFKPKSYIEPIFALALLFFIFFCSAYAASDILKFQNIFSFIYKVLILSFGVCLFSYVFCALFYEKNKKITLGVSKKNKIMEIIKIILIYVVIISVFLGGIIAYKFNVIALSFALKAQHNLILIILFLIGILISSQKLKKISWDDLKLPFLMILANSLFGLIMLLVWKDSLALLSGFGWASLSAAMISQKLGAFIAVQALMVDMLRGMFSILFIQFLSRSYPEAAISTTGVLSCDAFLPLIQKYSGTEYMLKAFKTGVLLSLFSPLNIFIAIYLTQRMTS
ncbi:LysO family transporter [Acinetobacter sp. P1(2025)]|uniref:LysO family transporter n=1 Tax=Acinetobacter sp. P1(2025) TaxID=3446120 RepID=UPI003F534C8C